MNGRRRGARTAVARRRLISLVAALAVDGGIVALLALGGGEAFWLPPADRGVAVRLELTHAPPSLSTSAPQGPRRGAGPDLAPFSPRPSGEAQAQAPVPAKAAASAPGLSSADPSPSPDRGANAGAGDADLHAKTALALRKLGACSRATSGTGDADDRALCTSNFAAADGATIDTIPIGKRANYDAAHAKAGYLVPADAADPNFKVSDFKRGGTVWTVHAGCDLVHGEWRCGVH